jgi:N-acetylated-alpha-linked acidic dipeptidase
MVRFTARIFVSLFLTCSLFAQTLPAGKSMMGFSAENSVRQFALEQKFDASLKRENLREWMKRLWAKSHHVGSTYGKENADFMLALFKSWSFDAQIEQFDVLFPTPKTRILELFAPEKFTAKLAEPMLKEDSTSNQASEQLPIYNAYQRLVASRFKTVFHRRYADCAEKGFGNRVLAVDSARRRISRS